MRKPELCIEYWPLDRQVPYGRNARAHSETQIAETAGSIRAFGFTNPILASADGDVIADKGRLAAARNLAVKDMPVVVFNDLTEPERRQSVLADSWIALNAGWDTEMLHLALKDLSKLGADLSTLGFNEIELPIALTDPFAGHANEDEVPDVHETAITRPGDIWCLGSRQLACGDRTDADAIAALLDGLEPQLMVTDPPYGVDYDPAWSHRQGLNQSNRRGKVLDDDCADWRQDWAFFPGKIAYVWHAATVAESLETQGFLIRAQIIWAKECLVIGRGDYHWQHEPCWYAVRKTGNWTGDRKQTTLRTISGRDEDTRFGPRLLRQSANMA